MISFLNDKLYNNHGCPHRCRLRRHNTCTDLNCKGIFAMLEKWNISNSYSFSQEMEMGCRLCPALVALTLFAPHTHSPYDSSVQGNLTPVSSSTYIVSSYRDLMEPPTFKFIHLCLSR